MTFDNIVFVNALIILYTYISTYLSHLLFVK